MTNAQLGEVTRDVMLRKISSREKLQIICEAVADGAVADAAVPDPSPAVTEPSPAVTRKKTTRKKTATRTG